MGLKAGTVDDFSSSMAEAMEQAMAQEYQRLKDAALPQTGRDDRRLLFAAIAQGVVRHLRDNPDAFVLAVETTQTGGGLFDSDGEVESIDTDGVLY
ncbi:MAG TPA: hypothetical protein ENI96_13495 [Sedimenticola thiotaurini]|uniref:Uncharacterized protein n=1 Tax=Sedimenticola thiotaurini TaxID=1543721 RepID=A0A831W8B4_9GAMM|nr:hypothetical protein [Sedimenticola thiotaurini]